MKEQKAYIVEYSADDGKTWDVLFVHRTGPGARSRKKAIEKACKKYGLSSLKFKIVERYLDA